MIKSHDNTVKGCVCLMSRLDLLCALHYNKPELFVGRSLCILHRSEALLLCSHTKFGKNFKKVRVFCLRNALISENSPQGQKRRSYNETTVGTVVYAVEDRKLRD